jgi:hypothetical protein
MKKIISAGLLALLTGCATILSGTTQVINIKVVDPQDRLLSARCSASDGQGNSYAIVTNPAAITVTKGNGSINITCHKSGYRQLNMAVGDNFDKMTIVNLLFWPGFIIDAASGAYKKYPSYYKITMEKIKHHRKS